MITTGDRKREGEHRREDREERIGERRRWKEENYELVCNARLLICHMQSTVVSLLLEFDRSRAVVVRVGVITSLITTRAATHTYSCRNAHIHTTQSPSLFAIFM